MMTPERIAEIEAREKAETPGTVEKAIGPIILTSMEPAARQLLEDAVALWTEHLYQMKINVGHVPEDPAYSFAYWLFRYSGLVNAHARADIPDLLADLRVRERQVEALRTLVDSMLKAIPALGPITRGMVAHQLKVIEGME